MKDFRYLVLVMALFCAATARAAPAEIVERETGLGRVFTTASGHSLYFYLQDVPGRSSCNGNCAKTWPPLIAPSNALAQGDWTPIKREDGQQQWAYQSRPLYRFEGDPGPGTILGHGVRDVWQIAVDLIPKPKWIKIQGSLAGWVAADSRGNALYVLDGETAEKPACVQSCLQKWRPANAPAAAVALGDWSPVARNDGVVQWAFRGRPLYTRNAEMSPGDPKNNLSKWHAVVLEPAPAVPSWMTVQPSDYGPILADARGMTVYIINDLEKVRREMCLDECMEKYWRPVLADSKEQAHGNWTIKPGEDGRQQWAYNGKLLYTHTRDTIPGQIEGDRFATGISSFGWAVIPQASLIPSPFLN